MSSTFHNLALGDEERHRKLGGSSAPSGNGSHVRSRVHDRRREAQQTKVHDPQDPQEDEQEYGAREEVENAVLNHLADGRDALSPSLRAKQIGYNMKRSEK